jgi:hypothetical protein
MARLTPLESFSNRVKKHKKNKGRIDIGMQKEVQAI